MQESVLSSLSIPLSAPELAELGRILASRSGEIRLIERSRIVLLAADGWSTEAIADQTGRSRTTVRLWRDRFVQRREKNPDDPVLSRLQDADRTGRPDRITAEQYVNLLALATADPQSLGFPFTHWSCRELARCAVQLGRVPAISSSQVQRMLSESDLQPHRVQEWMNRPDDPGFDARAERVTDVLAEAVAPDATPCHIVASFDEKSGMQALERTCADRPMQPGRPVKQEFEYRRNGTLTLLAMMHIQSGTIAGLCLPQRTNEDTAEVIRLFIGLLFGPGVRRVTVILDNLNTHMSWPMVLAVATLCNLLPPDPKTLDTMAKRRAWLENTDKPVAFLFTPKHASWLNPIERWFSVLVRRLLRRGSFPSLEDLNRRVSEFIQYYNDHLAHPYKLRHWNPTQQISTPA
jgi:transposase